MNYEFLHKYLHKHEFSVYPHEIECGSEGCEHEQNRLVDVAAQENGLFYAFEYKSSADRLLRAVKQVANYRKSFDYVIVVAEVPRTDISVNPKRGVRIKEILALGAGLWTVQFARNRNVWQRADLAKAIIELSRKSPIESHEIGTESRGVLKTERDAWFWLFYSVLDRRSNAATFIHAKEILQTNKLYTLPQIFRAINEQGKEGAVYTIENKLKSGGFALLKDRTMGTSAQPRSIVEAVEFLSHYNFNFTDLYNHFTVKYTTLHDARDMLWKALQHEIYSVGPRIASQFIRGMVLKGSWKLPLTSDMFLEECDFNVDMASKLGLIQDKTRFYPDLGKFAEGYLDGNRGIISHVLWFLRKRYCHKPPLCHECPLFPHCFQGELQWQFIELVPPTRQSPIVRNREWIEMKMLSVNSRILAAKQQMPRSQTRLSCFIKSNNGEPNSR